MIQTALLAVICLALNTGQDCEAVVAAYVRAEWEGDGKKVAELQDSDSIKYVGGSILVLAKQQLEQGSTRFADRIFGKDLPKERIQTMSPADAIAAYYSMLHRTEVEVGITHQDFRIIGSIVESNEICHVIYRETLADNGQGESEAHMLTCVRENGRWKVKMPLYKWDNYTRFFRYSANEEDTDEPE